jgi:protein-S-isoprenylcysteine O-methyltransferase Ste14
MTSRRRATRDGFAIGLIGYAAVALFYSAFDLLASRGTFHTVNMLGRGVFRGLRDPSVLQFPVDVDRQAIFAYNALHLVVALLIGFVVAGLVAVAEEHPSRRRIVRFIIVAGYAITVVTVGALTAPMRELLPWWSIMVANAMAAALAGAYLIVRHPGLWRRLALVAA